MPILQWLNRDDALTVAARTPYRLLEEVPGLSYGDAGSQNMLVQGDNLDALKALLPYYAGQVKCIYIDPPYNTGYAFEQYDDNLEHSTWLSLMIARLQLLRDFLSTEGSIWISIDDEEGHYMKVICDEIFGRKNFIATALWQKRTSPDARLNLGAAHEFILVYGKDGPRSRDAFNLLGQTDKSQSQYKNPDDDPRGPWASTDFTGQAGHATPEQFFTITAPNGTKHLPPVGRCWALAQSTFEKLASEGRVWYGKDGCSRPRLKRYLSESKGIPAWSWWTNNEVGHYQESKKEIISLFGKSIFVTPKPERLIKRVLDLATNPGDLVLDSFLGSGTTAAVAHKMGRRYIGIEMGEHAVTHCAPRLRKVVDGEQGGISKAVGWQGGGGFRFYRLGEAIFNGKGEINPAISFAALAAHIWFTETYMPLPQGEASGTVLGVCQGTAYALLYNGILKDRRVNGGNVLTRRTLAVILQDMAGRDYDKLVVYGEGCRLGGAALQQHRVLFKQTPYDVRA